MLSKGSKHVRSKPLYTTTETSEQKEQNGIETNPCKCILLLQRNMDQSEMLLKACSFYTPNTDSECCDGTVQENELSFYLEKKNILKAPQEFKRLRLSAGSLGFKKQIPSQVLTILFHEVYLGNSHSPESACSEEGLESKGDTTFDMTAGHQKQKTGR